LAGSHFGASGPTPGALHEKPALHPIHEAMIDRLESGEVWEYGFGAGPAVCFAPGTPEEVIDAFQDAMDRAFPDRYQQQLRWTSGVAIGSTGDENEPFTLTYSFAPDTTFIPSGVGEAPATSDLFAFLNGIYGNPATWQPLFHSVFERWGSLMGINYVYEPNDDGGTFFGNAGQLGIRGDIRIGGKFIDGNPNPSILAYNMYPSGGGDMVIDTGDPYYNETSNNSRRLHNVVAHEHGHGMGLEHVCPLLSQKLMEPRATTAIDGPQHDEIRGAQDWYGDIYEPNENAVGAEPLGLIATGTTVFLGAVPAPTITNGATLSINEDNTSPFANDEDWFEFSTEGDSYLTITVTPVGLTYQDNPQACPGQSSNCCSGSTVNSLSIANLAIQLRRLQGTSILTTANANGVGLSETIGDFPAPDADTYQVRVYTSSNNFIEPQLYTLSITSSAPPPPGSFNLVSPLNAQQDVPSGPFLDWTPSTGVAEYIVEVDTDIAFGSPDVEEMVQGGFSGVLLPDQTLAYATQYFWRVTAFNEQGSTLSTPVVSGFRTEEAPPPPCPCWGDNDGDCDTDIFDFANFLTHFSQFVEPFTNGDIDGDGEVTVFDFGLFVNNFGCETE
jgi:hypothetical protein